jgi:hypothetical protein
MDLEKLEREMRGKSELKALADSPEGKALSAMVDERALRSAAKQGDADALGDILRQVLSTPEGKALAEKVQKAVGRK